jgi:hypothetical protein
VEETIIELRGNGVVMTVYEIEKETLVFLQDRANRIEEDLSQLWFDPFFWHPPEMHQIKLGLKKVQDYRGLMNDDVSFMEIRMKGKKRKKYLIKELLGEDRLFPMASISDTSLSEPTGHYINVQEIVSGTGNLGKFIYRGTTPFHLEKIEFHYCESVNLRVQYVMETSLELHLVADDYLVRSAEVNINPSLNQQGKKN